MAELALVTPVHTPLASYSMTIWLRIAVTAPCSSGLLVHDRAAKASIVARKSDLVDFIVWEKIGL